MILLDTHIWVWWAGQHPNLTQKMQQTIQTHQASGLGVSIFSCWEVAKLVELGKLQFTLSTTDWLQQAIVYPGVQLLDLTRLLLSSQHSYRALFIVTLRIKLLLLPLEFTTYRF